MSSAPPASPSAKTLSRLSVVIPARDEAGCIAATIEHLHVELRLHDVPHEIIVVDEHSTDRTWEILQETSKRIAFFRTGGSLVSAGRLWQAWTIFEAMRWSS
jgi:glycosyltransferase involved in cell wall biosynthesis